MPEYALREANVDSLGDEKDRNLLVDAADLRAALDALDAVAPQTQKEEWYQRLAAALDLHLKPKWAPPGTTISH